MVTPEVPNNFPVFSISFCFFCFFFFNFYSFILQKNKKIKNPNTSSRLLATPEHLLYIGHD